ncbi:hypothetical protein [Massilia timonae]|uniref:hypothetical protein n=1 Tax=Massilia timonae TaxID=47229 RepID=UPI00235260AF|nr:hypothetical protein [Massilia timonae]
MNAVSEALMRRIGKIKALAERGVDGEQAAAQAMLENILARHNLTLADIEDERPARNWVEVNFVGKHERTLMTQVICKVAGYSGGLTIRQRKGTRSCFYAQLSPAEHVEVEFLFELMRRALADEFEKVLSAFIYRNRLYGPNAATDEEPAHQQTPEERARLRQVAAMAEAMNPVNVRKAIGA